ncbi:MAG: squalene/phytoene synthase family protein [Candidatus Zixiibacteriota bacterium]
MAESKLMLDFAPHLDFSQILTNPILDIAARFWDDDRYQAFRVCYRSMRRIDDLVDDRKSSAGPIDSREAAQLAGLINGWLGMVRRREPTDEYHTEFYDTLERFDLPLWPWERLGKAMIFDLTHNGFATFAEFLRYSEGAAVAPASIFMHLCGISNNGAGFRRPTYDIRLAARRLAIFSYIVHILRDFEKDQKAGLNYFSDDIVTRHGLTHSEVRQVASGGEPTPSFRDLVCTYVRIGAYYQRRARRTIDSIKRYLEPRYQLSLEIIYSLYTQIFERIEPARGQFTALALAPSAGEVQTRIEETVARFVALPLKP